MLDMFRSLSLPRALLMSADALHADRKFRLIAGFRWAGIDAQRAIRRTPADERGAPSRLLRLSKNLPHDWKEQRCFLGFAA